MNTSRQLCWRRLGLFMKSDLVINFPRILIYGMTIFAILFLYTLINYNEFLRGDFDPSAFTALLFVGGLWLTSRAFADLNNQEKRASFLLLPVSNLEKLLGRLLLTTVGYTAGIVLIFCLVSLLVAGFSWLVFGRGPVDFWPWHKNIIHVLAIYLLQHSIFFLGAIYYKSSNFNKTILSLCSLALVFILVTFIIFRGFLGWYFLVSGFETLVFYGSKLKLIFAVMFIPCIWLVAYLRLSESEI